MSFLDDEDTPPHYWHGRKWNAPMSDTASPMDEEYAHQLLDGSKNCPLCREPMRYGENIYQSPYRQIFHTECLIRSVLGNVKHLEGRCVCADGLAGTFADHPEGASLPGEDEQSYREESLAAIEWLIEHHRGGFQEVS